MARVPRKNVELVQAAERGDVDRLEQLLERGVDVNACDPSGQTALIAAAANGRLEAFDVLLAQRADPLVLDHWGRNALHHASYGGKPEMIRKLLGLGLDVNFPALDGFTPLMLAVMDERIANVRALLAAGAEINAQTTDAARQTPLKLSVGNARLEALLLAHGAQLDPHQDQVVGQMLAPGVDQRPSHVEQIRALQNAIQRGQVEQVRQLLAGGIHLEVPSLRHESPLVTAARHGQAEIFQLLLSAGATPSDQKPDGWSLLVVAANGGSAEIVGNLLERGADANHVSADRLTPLMAAAMGGHADVIRVLLAADADPNVRGGPLPGAGKTALEWAQDNQHHSAAAILAEASGLEVESALEDPAYAVARTFAQTAATPAFQAVLHRITEICGRAPVPWRKRNGVYSCSVRRIDEQTLTALKAEVAAVGFLMVPTGDSAKLLLFPTQDKYAVLVAQRINGANYGRSTRAIISWLRTFEADNPFELTVCRFDSLSGKLLGPVVQAESWSARMFEFCPDCGSADEILAGLEQGSFELWWD